MNVLIAIFAIIGTIFFVFLVALLGFYISISYGEDTGKLTDEEIKQINKMLFNNQK
jgi:uncharacterized membrane protein